MIRSRSRSARTAASLALTFLVGLVIGSMSATVDAQIADSKCYESAGKFGRKVAQAQNKENAACVKAAGKGKLTSTVEACITADVKKKVQKGKDKVSDQFATGAACDQLGGTDLVTSDAAVNAAKQTEALNLLHDIFGEDLDAGQIVADKAAAKCQERIARAAGKFFDAWMAGYERCKRDSVRGGAATTAAVISDCLSETAVNGTGSALSDGKGKVTKAGGKLGADIVKSCVEGGLDLDVLAPGACTGGGTQSDFSQCVQDLVEARACRAAKTADDLRAVDCDQVDNGVADGTAAASCEILNGAECLLPYPSNHWLVPDASKATGLRVQLPPAAFFPVNGPAVSPDPYNQLDGFAPTSQILMHFPQGLDLGETNGARLLDPGCCGQPAGPPWIDTRTYNDRSRDADSPSVLIHAATGEHILHWLEVDSRAAGGEIPGRQVVFLRPGLSLIPGGRYIVAMRNLKSAGGVDIDSEPAFEALRDGTITTDPDIEARRARMESDVFAPLVADGIVRSELDLAFDFTTQSEQQVNGQMLSMRDQAFAWLETVESTPGQITFTVDSVDVVSDCLDPDDVLWKNIGGTFQSPLFLDGLPEQDSVQFMSVDANDVPVQNGFMDAPYDISIPCSVFDGGVTSRPIILGHGIFGDGRGMVQGIPFLKAQYGDWSYISGGTDWIGLSGRRDDDSDAGWIAIHIVGIGDSQFNNFPAFPDRLRQGMLNTLVLAKMMKLGLFNRDPAFEVSPGVGAFPGPSEEMYYHGISLGGVHGTWFMGLSPDVVSGVLDVPSINFSCLLQRSTQFSAFETIIELVGVTDPMDFAMLVTLIHELWVAADPASVATHITSDPLPGSGVAKKLLYHPAWLDKQVSNQCTEISARTLQLVNLEGSLVQGMIDIPDSAGPVDSAMVMYDTGAFDIFEPLHQPDIPPLTNNIPTSTCDPHNGPRDTPAAVLQMLNFMQPGGQVVNFCNGTCDAAEPLEIPGAGECDLASPLALQGVQCVFDADCGGGTCVAEVCDPLAP
jgi:hypothetical protein